MKVKQVHMYLIGKCILSIVGLGLSGCKAIPETAFPMATPTIEVTKITETPQLLTVVPQPGSTVFFTPELTSTSSSLPSTPILPIPTLSEDEQESYLENLISTNESCRFPCFMGIIPGVSTWEVARSVIVPIRALDSYAPNETGFLWIVLKINQHGTPILDLGLGGNDEIIETILLDSYIDLPDDRNFSPDFAQTMRQYDLPNFLAMYGPPSRILLEAWGQIEPGAGTQATVVLLYDEAGTLVQYHFEDVVTMEPVTGILHTCLDYEHTDSMNFYLQNPNNDSPLEYLGQDKYNLSIDLEPLEEITDLNIQDFYHQFVASNGMNCFDVP